MSYDLYFYCDRDGKEIDLLLIYPFEIKKTASPNKEMIKNFNVLEKTKKDIGGVICLYPEIYPLTEKDKVISISCIF